VFPFRNDVLISSRTKTREFITWKPKTDNLITYLTVPCWYQASPAEKEQLDQRYNEKYLLWKRQKVIRQQWRCWTTKDDVMCRRNTGPSQQYHWLLGKGAIKQTWKESIWQCPQEKHFQKSQQYEKSTLMTHGYNTGMLLGVSHYNKQDDLCRDLYTLGRDYDSPAATRRRRRRRSIYKRPRRRRRRVTELVGLAGEARRR